MNGLTERTFRPTPSLTFLRGMLVCGALACAPEVCLAGEQDLTFQLVTHAIDVKTEKIAEIDGQVVSTGRYAGAAVFADGRIASKDFTFSFDFKKGAGPFYGYSTYTFVDGSSLVMRFEGTLEPGKPMLGRYTVISGTGVYQGATGTGQFEKVDDPWERANLYKGKLRISTP